MASRLVFAVCVRSYSVDAEEVPVAGDEEAIIVAFLRPAGP
jgi:hypothetical protein